MKKSICILLCVMMMVSMVLGSGIPVSAAGSGITVSETFQTTSKFDIGLDYQNVRLGWKLDAATRGVTQSSYHVLISDNTGVVWDSGWVVSAEQTGIKAQNLKPETAYTWKVSVKDQNGNESGFSAERTFDTAPLSIGTHWIGSGSKAIRKTFTLQQNKDNIDRARLYVGSACYAEPHLNGWKIGDLVLAPRPAVADYRILFNTYDVLSYLQDGQNTAGFLLANTLGNGGKAVGMIKIYYKDGATQVIETDDSWTGNPTCEVTWADHMLGENQNASLLDGWDTNDYIEDATWKPVTVTGSAPVTLENGQLIFSSNAGVYMTKQSFSGSYTIETKVKITKNVFGLMFGSGSPNNALWQLSAADKTLRLHRPGSWDSIAILPNTTILENTYMVLKIEITGNVIKTYLDGTLIDTYTANAGQTTGPIGFRSALDEAFDVDYLKVTQGDTILLEDNFDSYDDTTWTFPSEAILSPALTGATIVAEQKPVSITPVNIVDRTRPYTENGKLIVPEPTSDTRYYTKQNFSGDYTIELTANVKKVAFGLLFGNGNPLPAMWQFTTTTFRTHNPGNWTAITDYPNPEIGLNKDLTMKIDVAGNTVTSYVNGASMGTTTLNPGETSGPIGLRVGLYESFEVDYIKVTQGGQTIFEDNFNTIDTSKWTFQAQAEGSSYVVDFGKNMSGFVRFSGKGEAGQEVTIKYAELINADGSIYPNTTYHDPKHIFTFSGGDDTFQSKFFTTGFRYVEVSNYPDLTAEDIVGCFVSDDNDVVGDFSSSNERLNRIFDLYKRAQISNLLNNYTDCPQREKNGWTGDASVVKEAAAMLLNDYTSAESYMQSMYDDIFPDGMPFIVVPMLKGSPQGVDIWGNIDPPWSSAYFVFPYQTYMQTGDQYYLEMAYPSLVRVFNYFRSLDTDHDYIMPINTFGDWVGYDMNYGKLDPGCLSSTYVYYNGMLLLKMGEILGKDVSELRTYMNNMYHALQEKYNKTTYFSTNTQTGNAMALDFDLIPPQQKDTIINSLIGNVNEYNQTIRTGVLGTKAIYNVLSEANEHKLLMDMTLNPQKCSFGYMLDNGATTLWEYWDKPGETWNSNTGPGNNRFDSQNHVMLGGSFASWTFEGLGGITKTGAGYKEITFRPGLESELTSANAKIDTVRGLVASNWRNQGGVFNWEVNVPVNSVAKIVIPIADAKMIFEDGRNIFKKDGNGLTYVGQQDGAFVYTAGSGNYQFTAYTDKPEIRAVTVNAVNPETEITAVQTYQDFGLLITVPADVASVKIANENGGFITKRSTAVIDNGDGTKTFTAVINVGTAGDSRQLSIFTAGEDDIYTDSGVTATIKVIGPTPAITSVTSNVCESVNVNEEFTITVVTTKTVDKLKLTNENGLSLGILSKTSVIEGNIKTWVLTVKVGTKGERTIYVHAAPKGEDYLEETMSVNVTVMKP